MNKFSIGFILLLIPLFAFTMHKYYLSSTKIEYKKESKTIQITMRFFIDDLQETINRTYSKNSRKINFYLFHNTLIFRFNLD